MCETLGQCELPSSRVTGVKQAPKLIREIAFHKDSGGLNDLITIYGVGGPSKGGAQDQYVVSWLDWRGGHNCQYVNFQSGVQTENGINGITAEVLLAILIDRMQCFLSGEFPSEETKVALDHCSKALDALKARTADRLARKVHGKYEK